MTTPRRVLGFYARPAAMTAMRRHAPMAAALPEDIGALVRVVQGLLLHQHWAAAYDVPLPEERRGEAHLRRVGRMLDRLLARDGRPLCVARAPDQRLVGVCRHFAVLLVALLRANGVPARVRCGFATYFQPGRFESHWVCECWEAEQGRWMLVDPQIDTLQHAELGLDFDSLDVPRDRFLVAGEAWTRCRAGAADPARFGISDLRGLGFLAGNLLRDLAALNKVEMLPWDHWGAMSGPRRPLAEALLDWFDGLAGLSTAPDPAFAELRARYAGEDRLRVPAAVFNPVLNRLDPV